MKKKEIILSLIGIVVVSVGLMIIINKNTKKVIMQDGTMLAMTLDGSPITEFPSSTNYRVEIDCVNGRGKVLPEDGTWKFSVDNIEGNVRCYIDFYSRTVNDKLINIVQNLAGTTQGKGKLVHEYAFEFKTNNTLGQANYMNLNNDTTYPWIWSDTDKTWTSSNKGTDAEGSTSTISFNPNSDGYYQLCYIQPTGDDINYGMVYKNDTEALSFIEKTVTNFKCEPLGNLSTSDTIKITYQNADNYNEENNELSFYIQTGTYSKKIADVGYRYEGTNPNNYIWFNNEMWRIIGSIPTKVDASGTTTNLVKIIRKDVLGGIAYDAKTSYEDGIGVWGSNTLYTLLNSYYYGKKNGTNTAYCYGYQNTLKSKCDYSINGISNDDTDYYGRMVKNVYWNTGESDYESTLSIVYTTEKVKQTVQGRIGLMSASDYGYAASSADHNSTKLNYYGDSDITLSNWLYSQGSEWTNIQDLSAANFVLVVVEYGGSVSGSYAISGNPYRPVVYLNENVYVISGNGTEADPYIVGM